MKYFDLFAGIGGFALALDRQGHEAVGACEINNYPRSVYGRRFPHTTIYHDANRVDWSSVPSFNILTAGFPCQAFSIAGKRKGFADTRGTVFFQIERCLESKKPEIFILENVKGLLNHDKGKTFRIILETLTKLGYDIEWQVINTKDYLPQNRERVFIIGYLRGTSRREIFPLYKGSQTLDSTQGKTPEERKRIRSTYTRALDASYYKGGSHGSLIKVGHIGKDQQGMRVYEARQSNKVLSPEGIACTLSSQGGGWGAKTGLYMVSHKKANMTQRYQKRDNTWTLDTTGNKMGIEQGDRIRRLTPKECERLQGFPDDWTFGLSDTQRYKCLGNAVSVPVVEDILKALFP